MKKNKNETALMEPSKAEKYTKNVQIGEEDFSTSISESFKKKNEKGFFAAICATLAVVVLLIIAAVADLLTLCFQVNRTFGYIASGIAVILIVFFIIRPIFKVLNARFFVTDITSDNKDIAKKKNARVLRDVASSLIEYNENPKNSRFRYITSENTELLKASLKKGNKEVKEQLKKVYATDVGSFANSIIFKSAGKVFLTTSLSQNDRIDAISVLLVNLSLVKQIVGIYGYRPSYVKLFRIYTTVLRNSLIAYGMQNVNWFNVFGKFFSGVAKKIPFIDTIVDSAVQGTVSAFLTLLVGYKTKKYLCSDYKKQEKIMEEDIIDSTDDEVKIAAALADEIRKNNKQKEAE